MPCSSFAGQTSYPNSKGLNGIARNEAVTGRVYTRRSSKQDDEDEMTTRAKQGEHDRLDETRVNMLLAKRYPTWQPTNLTCRGTNLPFPTSTEEA